MEYSAKIYSRIGELMQGVLPDASAFLVSGLPSQQWFSEAVLRRDGARGQLGFAGADPGTRKAPGGVGIDDPSGSHDGRALPPKAMEALGMLEQQVGRRLPPEVAIEIQSNIPWGKGLSSSSTDVLSVLSVVNAFLGAGLMPADLYRIAARVEPTDPCLSGEIQVFYQHTGDIGATIDLPSVTLLYFDAAPGSSVDTVAMRRRWPSGAGDFFSWLLHRMVAAAAAGDYKNLFECITHSAEYNQLMLPLPGFAELYRLAEETESGMVIAHSGTIAGLLTKPDEAAGLMPRVEALVESRRIAGQAAQPVYLEHYHSPHHRSLWPAFPAP
jgi:uncharacterized protein involved in propanediol utilization